MAQLGTRSLRLTIDGTERYAEVSYAAVRSAAVDEDERCICDVDPRKYVLGLTLSQDAATGSLWSEVWDHAGEQVPVTLMPYGNAVPSEAEPHFAAVATIAEPDGDFIGGGASPSPAARLTVEVDWPLADRPTRVAA